MDEKKISYQTTDTYFFCNENMGEVIKTDIKYTEINVYEGEYWWQTVRLDSDGVIIVKYEHKSDSEGNEVEVLIFQKDQRTHLTRKHYDDDNKIIERIDYILQEDNNETKYIEDKKHTYHYNESGLLTKESYFNCHNNKYYLLYNLIYLYDKKSRLIEKQITEKNIKLKRTELSYTSEGKLRSKRSYDSQNIQEYEFIFFYDMNGHESMIKKYDQDGNLVSKTIYQYDDSGNLTLRTFSTKKEMSSSRSEITYNKESFIEQKDNYSREIIYHNEIPNEIIDRVIKIL